MFGFSRDGKSWRYWRYISAIFLAGANFGYFLGHFGNFGSFLGHYGQFWVIFGLFWVIFRPFFGAIFFWPEKYLCYFYYFLHLCTGQAGSQLADSPVEKHHCGTLASGWMAEGHPTVGEGEVIRTVN